MQNLLPTYNRGSVLGAVNLITMVGSGIERGSYFRGTAVRADWLGYMTAVMPFAFIGVLLLIFKVKETKGVDLDKVTYQKESVVEDIWQIRFLHLNTYIADGEPHVFGNRVYLFGSHDKKPAATPNGCATMNSHAPLWEDLETWSCKGVSYRADQDPLYGEKLKYMYAPDVVQGNDGRFYLYYCDVR